MKFDSGEIRICQCERVLDQQKYYFKETMINVRSLSRSRSLSIDEA